jgi:hypothetical protein
MSPTPSTTWRRASHRTIPKSGNRFSGKIVRKRDQLRCAVQVPEQSAARQVPEPDVPLRRPEPTARFMPVLRVTLIVPASATRPDALTVAVLDATRPLLMPIATEPVVHAAFDDEIWTFHWPSNDVLAATGVASKRPANSRLVSLALRNVLMVVTFPPLVFPVVKGVMPGTGSP